MKNCKKEILAKAVTKIATQMANNAGGSASGWITYQPKEPQNKSKEKG